MSTELDQAKEVLEKNGYRLLKEIGRGVNSVCYRVLSIKYDQVFVCKVIPKVVDLEEELNTFCNIFHQNVIVCFFFFEDNNKYYLILEECPGGSLEEEIKRNGPITGDLLLQYTFQIANAINYLHENQISHLNLKPSNVLIDRNGNLKVSDIRFSELMHMETKESLLKDPNYMYIAPEIIQRSLYSSEKADSWSFGVLIYYMARGVLPWDSKKEPSEVLQDMIQMKFDLPKDTEQNIYNTIKHVLIPDPMTRLSMGLIIEKLTDAVPMMPQQNQRKSGFTGSYSSGKIVFHEIESGQRTHVNCINPSRVMRRGNGAGGAPAPLPGYRIPLTSHPRPSVNHPKIVTPSLVSPRQSGSSLH